jgi:hypothetical protein
MCAIPRKDKIISTTFKSNKLFSKMTKYVAKEKRHNGKKRKNKGHRLQIR